MLDLLQYELHIQTKKNLSEAKCILDCCLPQITTPTRITPHCRTLIDYIYLVLWMSLQ